MNDISIYFKLIAARAEIMASQGNNVWASQLHGAVSEIRQACDKIEQEARNRDGSDR